VPNGIGYVPFSSVRRGDDGQEVADMSGGLDPFFSISVCCC
jgi:hypothetical protein